MAPGRGSNQQLSDEELARKLQAELNDGFAADGDASQEYHLSHRSRNTTSASTPKEIARNSGESANPSAALALRPKPQGNLPGQVEADIEVLQQFYAQLTSTRCYRCQSSIARDFDAKKHLGTWSNAMAGNGASGVTKSVCAVMCSKADCRASTCLGCGRKPTVGVNTMSTKTGYLDWCCDVGRLFAIWIFLARYDQVELKMQETEASKAAEKVRNLAFAGSNRHQRQDQKGKGYVSNAGFDDIFAMLDESRMYGQRSVRAINFQSADTLTDDVLGQLLTLTSLLLPSRSRQPGSGFDKEPPSTLNAALRLGLLVDKVAQLLRNDSIADITKRSPVYFPALQFVKILVSHRSTSDLVTQERYYKRGTSGLQVLSAPGVAGDIKGKGKATPQQLVVLGEAKDGNAPAVIKRLENLVKQSQIMLGFGRAEGTRRELGSETDQITMRLCETIVKVYDRIGCATPGTIGDTGDMSLTKGRGARKVKSWSEFHREKCFDLTEAVFDQYHFNKNLDLLHSPKGRIPYLMKEMASMSTSLPEGVFVKASSEIPGMMKCLILGPDDTPYEGGLFEYEVLANLTRISVSLTETRFDIGAASNYPEQPPAVFFRGTHSARADMNPNLHVDGKGDINPFSST